MSSSVIMVTSKGLSQNTENSTGVSGGGLRVALLNPPFLSSYHCPDSSGHVCVLSCCSCVQLYATSWM